MLDGIDQKLRHDQADAHGLTRNGGAGPSLHHDSDRPVGADHRLREAVAELRQIRADLDSISESRPAQLLLHGRHRHDPLMRVLKVPRVSSDCTVRAFRRRMLAMIWRLLATRCRISSSSISFSRSSSSFSRSAARLG